VAVPVTIARGDAELVLAGATINWSMTVVGTARACIALVGVAAAVLATTLRGLSRAPWRAAATTAAPAAASRLRHRHVAVIERKGPLVVGNETYGARSGTGVDVQPLHKIDDAPLAGIDLHTDLQPKQKLQQRLVQRRVPEKLWEEEHRRRVKVDGLVPLLPARSKIPAFFALNGTDSQGKVGLQVRELVLVHGVEKNGLRLNDRRRSHLACYRLLRVGFDDLGGRVGFDVRTDRMDGMNSVSGMNTLNGMNRSRGMNRIGTVNGADSKRHYQAVTAKVHTFQTEA